MDSLIEEGWRPANQAFLTDIIDFLQDFMDSLIEEGGGQQVFLTDIIDSLKTFMDSLIEEGVASKFSLQIS